jgi:DNA-directed RNA polymerase I, II, and III subunit RPABC1
MSSINVEFNSKEINLIIMENVLKMLERRRLIDSWSDHFKKISADTTGKTSFNIEVKDKKNYSIYLVNAKLTSIVQGTPLDEYLSNNLDIHKIVVAKDVAKKVVKQIVSNYTNAEFFFESEMMEDIPSKVFIPVHQLLSQEEKNELLNKFSEQELARIFLTDMMSRYYGAKIGDIFRIIRPSFTSGKNVFYRRVVNGSWDILFET